MTHEGYGAYVAALREMIEPMTPEARLACRDQLLAQVRASWEDLNHQLHAIGEAWDCLPTVELVWQTGRLEDGDLDELEDALRSDER